jgi:hypothetical protein
MLPASDERQNDIRRLDGAGEVLGDSGVDDSDAKHTKKNSLAPMAQIKKRSVPVGALQSIESTPFLWLLLWARMVPDHERQLAIGLFNKQTIREKTGRGSNELLGMRRTSNCVDAGGHRDGVRTVLQQPSVRLQLLRLSTE